MSKLQDTVTVLTDLGTSLEVLNSNIEVTLSILDRPELGSTFTSGALYAQAMVLRNTLDEFIASNVNVLVEAIKAKATEEQLAAQKNVDTHIDAAQSGELFGYTPRVKAETTTAAPEDKQPGPMEATPSRSSVIDLINALTDVMSDYEEEEADGDDGSGTASALAANIEHDEEAKICGQCKEQDCSARVI